MENRGKRWDVPKIQTFSERFNECLKVKKVPFVFPDKLVLSQKVKRIPRKRDPSQNMINYSNDLDNILREIHQNLAIGWALDSRQRVETCHTSGSLSSKI